MMNIAHATSVRALPSWRTIALGLAVFALSFPLWLR